MANVTELYRLQLFFSSYSSSKRAQRFTKSEYKCTISISNTHFFYSLTYESHLHTIPPKYLHFMISHLCEIYKCVWRLVVCASIFYGLFCEYNSEIMLLVLAILCMSAIPLSESSNLRCQEIEPTFK